MFTNTISAREIMRDYKNIFNKVNKTGKPVVVISNNKPLGVIISLSDYTNMQTKVKTNSKAATYRVLRELTGSVKGLSPDLSENHDKIYGH